MFKAGWCVNVSYQNDMVLACVFALALMLISTFCNLPFKLYSTFVIEEKYGFNKTTGGTFVKDQIKGFLIGLVLQAILIPLLLWIIEKSGHSLIINLAATSIVLIILLSLLLPTVIIPMFYTYSDLEEGELRELIFKEAEKT